MKRIMAILLLLVIVFTFVACGERENTSTEEKISITYAGAAIDRAKNGDGFSSASFEISWDLGFKEYYKPDWGTCNAEKNADGSWKVTLKGKMSGYIDDYHDEYESYTFEYTVTVEENGDINWSSGQTKKVK